MPKQLVGQIGQSGKTKASEPSAKFDTDQSNSEPKRKLVIAKRLGVPRKVRTPNFPILPSMRITRSTCLDKQIFVHGNIRLIGQAHRQLIFCLLKESKCIPVATTTTTSSSTMGSIAVASTSSDAPTPPKLTTEIVAATPKTRPLLLAFDQHAVHERIRFEKLRTDVFDSKTGKIVPKRVMPPAEYLINERQHREMSKLLPELERVVGLKCFFKPAPPGAFGLSFATSLDANLDPISIATATDDSVGSSAKGYILAVSQVPLCFKNYHEAGPFLDFIEDALRFLSNPDNHLPADGQVPRPKLSPYLLELVKTQACRGAIRFGETLNRQSCVHMIEALSLCRQNFRCAHGRVLVKPVVYIPEDMPADGTDETEQEYGVRLSEEFKRQFPDEIKVSIVRREYTENN